MDIGIVQAIISIAPTAKWVLMGDDYSSLDWKDTNIPKPTEDQINAEIASLKARYEANSYQHERAVSYPKVEDQLDMLWHMMDQNVIPGKNSSWYNSLLAVKNKYPKP